MHFRYIIVFSIILLFACVANEKDTFARMHKSSPFGSLDESDKTVQNKPFKGLESHKTIKHKPKDNGGNNNNVKNSNKVETIKTKRSQTKTKGNWKPPASGDLGKPLK